MSKTFLSEEEYLEIERKAEFRSEYFAGEMFAMAGATRAHNLIVFNLSGQLYAQLRSRQCQAFTTEMRVKIAASGLYAYPDVVVACDAPRFLDGRQDTLLNPNLILEVLSPSTEGYDRGHKFEQYRTIDSLVEYLSISTDRMQADLYSRQPDGRWLLTSASKREDTIELQSVGCRIPVAALYEKVELAYA